MSFEQEMHEKYLYSRNRRSRTETDRTKRKSCEEARASAQKTKSSWITLRLDVNKKRPRLTLYCLIQFTTINNHRTTPALKRVLFNDYDSTIWLVAQAWNPSQPCVGNFLSVAKHLKTSNQRYFRINLSERLGSGFQTSS